MIECKPFLTKWYFVISESLRSLVSAENVNIMTIIGLDSNKISNTQLSNKPYSVRFGLKIGSLNFAEIVEIETNTL